MNHVSSKCKICETRVFVSDVGRWWVVRLAMCWFRLLELLGVSS